MTKSLTEDQEKRIAATLKRIRAGLSGAAGDHFGEPSHLFDPEAHDVAKPR
ncbi:hypothetical protein [Actibacterium mucosum]|uniref:hypothetical protein n=1 Tax=Actibacterium mucosum TaxID=1087332 RepID=UPI0013766A03|nr:hypothetical protein [Actibacterium mucosum]